jgi:hypothetical protein
VALIAVLGQSGYARPLPIVANNHACGAVEPAAECECVLELREVVMRIEIGILVFSALALVAASVTPAAAAAKKTRDQCMQLASQRGFNGSGDRTQAAAKRTFVVSCMQGKQN